MLALGKAESGKLSQFQKLKASTVALIKDYNINIPFPKPVLTLKKLQG